MSTPYYTENVRGTEVWVKLSDEDGDTITAEAICHPNDNFSKRTGRKMGSFSATQEVVHLDQSRQAGDFREYLP